MKGHLKMDVNLYLILKVINNGINVIALNGQLPVCKLHDGMSIDGQMNNFLLCDLKLSMLSLDLKHVTTKIIHPNRTNAHLGIFYSSFVPKDFIDGKNSEFIKDFSIIDPEIQQEIQSSLRIPAY